MAERVYLNSVLMEFKRLKRLADAALSQLDDTQFFLPDREDGNSAAILTKHMSGNMLSRWRDFLDTDGEKPDRDRDSDGKCSKISATAEASCDSRLRRTRLVPTPRQTRCRRSPLARRGRRADLDYGSSPPRPLETATADATAPSCRPSPSHAPAYQIPC